MQKKLLAAAIAGALAAPGAALAQVEVYGFVSMALGKFKYSDSTSGAASVSKWDVASGGSNVGVRGRETLGGGLTAWFQVETNAAMERSNNVAHTSNFASRNSALGLQGNWGNFFIGQWTTPWADLESLWSVGTVGFWGPSLAIIGRRETTGAAPNPNCANNFSGNGGVGAPAGLAPTQTTCDSVEGAGPAGGGAAPAHPFWRRISNSVHYQSPVFSGFQVKVAYQTNQDKATTGTVADPSMWSSSATWSGMGGRARIGFSLDGHKDFTTIGQTDSGWAVKGGYNFGFVDVGLAYESMEFKFPVSDCEAKQWGVALAVPVGQGAIRASYAVADDIDGTYGVAGSCGATTAAADNGAKQWNIGYDYRFSKRTTAGFGYAQIKNDSAAFFTWSGAPSVQNGQAVTPLAGSDPSTFFVTMIHRF
jgi:predicted porin